MRELIKFMNIFIPVELYICPAEDTRNNSSLSKGLNAKLGISSPNSTFQSCEKYGKLSSKHMMMMMVYGLNLSSRRSVPHIY
jgi:hypothetical protein